MTTRGKENSEQYRDARKQFDELRIEDKAVFLLESTVTTLARGLETLGLSIGETLERTFDEAERRSRRSTTSDDGDTEPEDSGEDSGDASASTPPPATP